jgi:hypothetical protein
VVGRAVSLQPYLPRKEQLPTLWSGLGAFPYVGAVYHGLSPTLALSGMKLALMQEPCPLQEACQCGDSPT